MKKLLVLVSLFLLTFGMLVACGDEKPQDSVTEPMDCTGRTLNGVDIQSYVIVYDRDALDYVQNAAEFLQDTIADRTGVTLQIRGDDEAPSAHEIIVGETSRTLSAALAAETEGFSFALLADETSIAMEADSFVIAAAAYYFAETYVPATYFDTNVPKSVTLEAPIVKAPENYIFLIGDGMGVYQTKLFDYMDASPEGTHDGETLFYGYMLPYTGYAKTNSLTSGATDSAASGTALATGYKTYNKYIGKDKDKNDIMSLTELADSLGKATAVMSTEVITGATPSAFSAHAENRNDTAVIEESQKLLTDTILKSLNNSFDDEKNHDSIADVLDTLSADRDGFFLMYEEAYIDKRSHENNMEATFEALARFNQAIGQFMEFAFYHPETMVIITADHETGDLKPDTSGRLSYHSGDHSVADVPVFAYGVGAEVFDAVTVENVQIPKTIAKMWGKNDFGDTASDFPPLGE